MTSNATEGAAGDFTGDGYPPVPGSAPGGVPRPASRATASPVPELPLRAKVASSVSDRRGAVAGRGAWRRRGDRRLDRAQDRPRPAHPPGRAASRPGVRHQRQDHHHPAHRRRGRRARPGRHQRVRRQHAHGAHLGAGPGRLHPVRGAGSGRALPGPGAGGHHSARGGAAQPQPGPARPGQGGRHDGLAVAGHPAWAGHPGGRQRRRPDGGLGCPASRPPSPGSPPANAGTTTRGCAPQ